MAKLPQSTGGTGLQITDLAPVGQHVAVCLRVNDQFGVERPTFENPQVKEIVDVTRFVFGIKDQSGKQFLVQTYEFNISGAPGANLMKFLKSWLGTDPIIGWDYAEMKGKGAMLTIQHKAGKKNASQLYSNIVGVTGVHPQLAMHIPSATEFEAKLAALERAAANPPANSSHQTPPPGPTSNYPAAHSAPSFPPPPMIAPVPVVPVVPILPPPLPPVIEKKYYAHINGAAVSMTASGLQQLVNTGAGATPAIAEGETAWRTAADYCVPMTGISAPLFPPVPSVPQGASDEVPF